jgi:hypothetical protein
MRDSQTCPNPCSASLITRSWSRGKRFESACRTSGPKLILLATAVVWMDFYLSTHRGTSRVVPSCD